MTGGLARLAEACHETPDCIVIGGAYLLRGLVAIQNLYHDQKEALRHDIVLRYSAQQGHDTPQGHALARYDTAAWACDTTGGPATTRRHCVCARAALAHLVSILGQLAVHLMHPASFWTQYYF